MKRMGTILLSIALLLSLLAGTVWAAPTVLQQETAVQTEEIAEINITEVGQAAEFVYGEQTYYMSVSPTGWFGPLMAADEYTDFTVDVVFQTKVAGENGEADEFFDVSEETAQELRTVFGAVAMTVAPAKVNLGGGSIKAPDTWPEITSESGSWEAPLTLSMGHAQMCCWLVTASGEINGQTVETSGLVQWWPSDTETHWFNSVEAVNSWLKTPTAADGSPVNADLTHILLLEPGEYAGQIVVPESIGDLSIQIEGYRFDHDGSLGTTLRGGIQVEGGFAVSVWNLNLVGAGSNQKTWKHSGHEANGEADNFALNGVGTFHNCTFTDYYYGVYCGDSSEILTTGKDSVFTNNRVAIYYENTTATGGNPQMWNNTFLDNQVALHFAELSNSVPTTFFEVRSCRFIDNQKDVRNQLGRNLYLPGNFFGTVDANGEVVARDCIAQENGSGSGVETYALRTMALTTEEDLLDSSNDAPTYVYPRCSDQDCTDMIYAEEAPVVSVAHTGTYTIPADHLNDMEITVMDAEEELAVLSFAGETEARATFALRRAVQQFDATVSVDRAKDGKRILFTMNDPVGKTPTVRISVDDSWKTAAVFFENSPLDSELVTVEDGHVCFTAANGGDYTIVKTSLPQEGGSQLPSAPPKPETKPAAPVVSPSFSDVHGVGHWAKDSVDFVTARGLFLGVGGSRFDPDGSMTRAMLMTVLARLDGRDTTGGKTWYEPGMNWAIANGISDGSDPNGSITREQLVTMLYRYAGQPEVTGDLSAFPDGAQVSSWAADAMIWAVETGLIKGMDGKLAPQATATRAQVATILLRFTTLI